MIFVSRYTEPRFVMRPTRKMFIDNSMQLIPGKTIEFSNHEYITQDEEEIAFLKAHREFGVTFDIKQSAQEIQSDILKMAEKIKAEGVQVSDGAKDAGAVFVCDKCGFEAKSKLGLQAHSKKHE